MTDLQICKQLKACGVPWPADMNKGAGGCVDRDNLYKPTLQGLLDYLGERFMSMKQFVGEPCHVLEVEIAAAGSWVAWAYTTIEPGIGDTAWEALALLVIEVANE